jgi:hypothetical protein
MALTRPSGDLGLGGMTDLIGSKHWSGTDAPDHLTVASCGRCARRWRSVAHPGHNGTDAIPGIDDGLSPFHWAVQSGVHTVRGRERWGTSGTDHEFRGCTISREIGLVCLTQPLARFWFPRRKTIVIGRLRRLHVVPGVLSPNHAGAKKGCERQYD